MICLASVLTNRMWFARMNVLKLLALVSLQPVAVGKKRATYAALAQLVRAAVL